MFRKILVPLDGSALAEAILPRATELAKDLGAELLLLRVAMAHVFPGVDPTEEEVRVVREAEEYVEALADKLAEKGARIRTAVRYGTAAAEIIAHIAANEVDLVAMSTHGRSGLSRLVMGSVAEEVVRNAGVPVLLSRAPGKPQEHR
ncbi:MAG: universal stress protein [Candidatus Methylomirabilales bacterium]